MRARYHDYCTEQTFFIQINPAEIRKNNPVVAAIDDFIENHISLEIFSAKCGNSVKGAPAMHAGMMLKVIFYCYSTGCYNSRGIEKRTSWDQNVIYLAAWKEKLSTTNGYASLNISSERLRSTKNSGGFIIVVSQRSTLYGLLYALRTISGSWQDLNMGYSC